MRNLPTDSPSRAKIARERLKYFFKETFRPHGKQEYAEVFTRGIGGEESGAVSRKLPWLYIRVFALNLILFSILVFTFSLARYSAGYMTAVLFGGLLFNIPLIIFFFELYSGRGISLLKLFSVLLIGGVVSTVIILFGYEYIYSTTDEPNPWISTLWVGFWEEFIKGAVAISAIAILKNKNPFVCFLIGFAVGTGYSFAEDLGYVYSLSRTYGTAWLVLTSVGRGLSCVCSHAPWTGIICWAFAKFKKPFINFRFYGIVLASMVLHYFADVPFFDEKLNILRGVTVGWAIEAVVVIAIFLIVFFMLRNSLRQEEKTEFPAVPTLTKGARLSASANLAAVLCAVAYGVFALIGCAVTVKYNPVYENFYDEESFLTCVQKGLPLTADWEREYVEDGDDLTQYYAGGVLSGATQKEAVGDYDYYYFYSFEEETPSLISIGVRVDGVIYYCRGFLIYENFYLAQHYAPFIYAPVVDDYEEDVEEEPEEPEEPEDTETVPEPVKIIYFFNVANVSCGYVTDGGYFIVNTWTTEAEGEEVKFAFETLSVASLLAGAVAFITLKIKSRRYKNDR